MAKNEPTPAGEADDPYLWLEEIGGFVRILVKMIYPVCIEQ